jgi:hypothetical protein
MCACLHDSSCSEFGKPTGNECDCRGILLTEFENKGIFVYAVENGNEAGVDVEKYEKEIGNKKQDRSDA